MKKLKEVYVLMEYEKTGSIDFDGWEVIGVYTTLELAKKALIKECNEFGYNYEIKKRKVEGEL